MTVSSLEIWSKILVFGSSVRKSHIGINNLKLAPTLGVFRSLAHSDTRSLEHSKGSKSKTNKETKCQEFQTESDWVRVAAIYPRTGGFPGSRALKEIHRFPGLGGRLGCAYRLCCCEDGPM